MYTGNVWGITLFIAGFLAALIGFQLLLAAVFPRWSDGAARTLRARPAASGLVGVLVIAGVILGSALLGSLGGPGKFGALLLVAFASFPAVGGLATVSRFVGERMPSPADDGRPWRATLRGGVTCSLAFVAPVVGWFLLLPVSILMGTGAVTLSRLAPSRGPAVAPPEAGAAA